MARQYLAEGLKGSFPFIADRSKIVSESLPNGGGTRTRIPGRFSVCDCVNGNNRRYGKRVWEKNFATGSQLMNSIKENSAWGLLEHPKDGQVDLRSPICIRTTAAQLQEGKDESGKPVWEVVGEISILNPERVPESNRLLAMIEEGYNPRVSSRGFGSLVKNVQDGVDDVQDDYICEGWDVVMKPSFDSAVLQPQREESTTESKTATITETAPATTSSAPAAVVTAIVAPGQPPVVTTTPGVKVTLEAEKAPTAAAAAPAKPITESAKSMNINEIKTQIASFRSVDPSKLGPQHFAESMSSMGTLHQDIANYQAEDPKRSWEAQRLHNEVSAIEQRWSETQQAPAKRATKLNEDNTKLMQVIKAVVTTGINLKKKLGEAVKQDGRKSALLNEVTERGQAWRQHAKAMESEAKKYQRRFMMASEALQQFAKKYKTDLTEVSRALLTLEFKDKISADLQKMLNEATKPKSLIPIRLALEGKITLETAQGIVGGKISLDETLESLKGTTQKVDESKKTAAPPVAENQNKPAAGEKPAAGSPTAPVGEGVTIVSAKPNDPRGLNEAVDMVARLSKATVGA